MNEALNSAPGESQSDQTNAAKKVWETPELQSIGVDETEIPKASASAETDANALVSA
jgi:hypothetical protein